MKQAIPLVVASVLAGIVFLARMADPVEACGRAIVTFVIVLLFGQLLLLASRKKDGA